MTLQILIIDDEPAVRQILAANLEKAGYAVDQANCAKEALAKLAAGDIDVAFCDICLPDMSGINVMKQVLASGIDTTFIMITAFASIDTVVEAMRAGATDYIIKPLHNEEVLHRLKQVGDLKGIRDQNRILRSLVMGESKSCFHFTSPAMLDVEHIINKVAPTESTVLITGESGVGKSIIARRIHQQSRRSDALFLPINCGAIPDTLIESEFFGHTKGAFTGAEKMRKGLFLQADGGTILLDEIGDLPLSVQSKLLQVLEEKQVRAVGSERLRSIDVRIIAATNHNLSEMVAAKKFREDLYFRLNAFHIHIPPLREMREDIPALITFLLQSVTSKTTTAYHKFIDPFVEKILIAYEWPGNVRELKNVLEHSSILADGDNISVDDLPPEIRKTHKTKIINDEVDSLNGDLRHMIHQFELSILTKAVKEASGDRRLAAQRLGIGLSSLYRKLEELEQRDSHSI